MDTAPELWGIHPRLVHHRDGDPGRAGRRPLPGHRARGGWLVGAGAPLGARLRLQAEPGRLRPDGRLVVPGRRRAPPAAPGRPALAAPVLSPAGPGPAPGRAGGRPRPPPLDRGGDRAPPTSPPWSPRLFVLPLLALHPGRSAPPRACPTPAAPFSPGFLARPCSSWPASAPSPSPGWWPSSSPSRGGSTSWALRGADRSHRLLLRDEALRDRARQPGRPRSSRP